MRPLGTDRLAAIERQLATLTRLAPRLALELPSDLWVETVQLMQASFALLAQGAAAPEPDLDHMIEAWEAHSARVLERFV